MNNMPLGSGGNSVLESVKESKIKTSTSTGSKFQNAISNLAQLKRITSVADIGQKNYEEILKENGKNMVYDYYAYLECNYDAERFWESTLKEKKPEVSPAEPTWGDNDNEGDERHDLNDCGYSFLKKTCINSLIEIENSIIAKTKATSEKLDKIAKIYSEISTELKDVDIEGMNLSGDYQKLSKNTELTEEYLSKIGQTLKPSNGDGS